MIMTDVLLLFIFYVPNVPLTAFMSLVTFYTPWKHQKTYGFSDVFRGYRKRLVPQNE